MASNKRTYRRSYFGTRSTDPLMRLGAKPYYLCQKCNQNWSYLGIVRHFDNCRGTMMGRHDIQEFPPAKRTEMPREKEVERKMFPTVPKTRPQPPHTTPHLKLVINKPVSLPTKKGTLKLKTKSKSKKVSA